MSDDAMLTQSPVGQVSGAPVAGNVSLDFNKSISDGVQGFLEVRQRADVQAARLRHPYVDTRPNLSPGPETRQYQFRYVLNDTPVGNMSPIVTVTVPG